MSYTKVGPFVDGGAPYLSAATFNTIETGIAAAATKADAALPSAARGFVTPTDYGAVGDLTTDDTAAVQAALDTGKAVLINGTFLTGALTNTHGNALYGFGMGNSIIKAKTGTGTLYTAVNFSELRISDLWFQGQNATTVVKTDWTNSAGPSLNSSYRNVRVTAGASTVTGWSALGNNDCDFSAILIDGITSDSSHTGNVAMDLRANGGAVHLSQCQFFGPMSLTAQVATITGCMVEGIRLYGLDYNLIAASGGYWYADPAYSCNIYIAAGGQIYSPLALHGVHLENQFTGAAIINGPGSLYGTSILDGCHGFVTNSATGVTVVGSSPTVTNPAPAVALRGGFFQGIAMTSAKAGIGIHTQFVNVDGFYSNIA